MVLSGKTGGSAGRPGLGDISKKVEELENGSRNTWRHSGKGRGGVVAWRSLSPGAMGLGGGGGFGVRVRRGRRGLRGLRAVVSVSPCKRLLERGLSCPPRPDNGSAAAPTWPDVIGGRCRGAGLQALVEVVVVDGRS
jgi:hypothetical protein